MVAPPYGASKGPKNQCALPEHTTIGAELQKNSLSPYLFPPLSEPRDVFS